MAEERGEENKTPWWRTIPAILTAAAAFIGSVAAVLALFVGPGGGGGSPREAEATPPPVSTSTEPSSVPPKNGLFAEEDVRTLLTMVPASLRSRCKQDPEEGGDQRARFSCELGGATVYYELYADEIDAQSSFSVSVSNAENFSGATGRAGSCREISSKRPFVGTWRRPGQSLPSGRQLCSYDFGVTTIYWTETGRPILGSMFYSAQSRESSVEGAQLVWERVSA